MGREIKFRGLGSDGKGWVYGSLILPHEDNENTYIQCGKGVSVKVIPETVGQFTGLTDKHVRDIYEGDQLHSTGYLCTIIWMNGCFRTVYNHPEDGETLILGEDIDHSNMTVIGNIHEK